MTSPGIESAFVECPYCGESIELVVDTSAGAQEYIEDCEVCCRPISLRLRVANDGTPIVEARHEDE